MLWMMPKLMQKNTGRWTKPMPTWVWKWGTVQPKPAILNTKHADKHQIWGVPDLIC